MKSSKENKISDPIKIASTKSENSTSHRRTEHIKFKPPPNRIS